MKTEQEISTEIKMPIKEIKVNGTNLAYIKKGIGEPVVFIHGAVSDFRTWLEQFDDFSKYYRVISYSRRYHQPNEKANDNSVYSRTSQTSDLVEFLKALNLEKAHLIGHSYGASIALMAALQNPELVGSLVLGEPSPFVGILNEEGTSLLSEQKAGFDEAIRLAKNGNRESAVRQFLKVIVGVDVLCLLPEEHRSVVLENAETLLPMLQKYYESPSITCVNLKKVNVPTLIITGELSPRIARLSNEMLHRYLLSSESVILKCASHGLQIENPKGFNQLVLDFLSVNKNSIKLVKKTQFK